ncbi:MAG: hypothetical protein PSX36_08640 [bacterium]|nr:hypothetical protein [bacterium]
MRSYLLLICLSIFVWACKKKETPPPEPINSSAYTISNAKSFSGFFSSDSYTISQLNATGITGGHSGVIFSSEPVSNMEPSKALAVSSVSHNDLALTFDNAGYAQYRSSMSYDLGKERWQIEGANGIPSFLYSVEGNDPHWSGFSTLPDTIRLSGSFSFTLSGLSNITSATLFLSDGTNGGHGGQISKELKAGDNVVVFNATDLSELMPSPFAGFLSIYAENTYGLNFFGKDFQFKKYRAYSKYLILLP